ncbi:MAG: hypothetical protein ACRER2_00900 [Methylococcales bacterium]
MKWSYALVRHYDRKMSKKLKQNVEWYKIHEVHMTDERKFIMWCDEPEAPHGETADETRADLARMLSDSFKGVLECNELPGTTPCKQCKRIPKPRRRICRRCGKAVSVGAHTCIPKRKANLKNGGKNR